MGMMQIEKNALFPPKWLEIKVSKRNTHAFIQFYLPYVQQLLLYWLFYCPTAERVNVRSG
jgi:hypothetical protein